MTLTEMLTQAYQEDPLLYHLIFLLCIALVGLSGFSIKKWVDCKLKDKMLKDIERKQLLKQEVYLEYARDLNICLGAFGQLTDPQVKVSHIHDALRAAAGSSAKLQLVAADGTVNAVAEISNAFDKEYNSLIAGRVELEFLHREVQDKEDDINKLLNWAQGGMKNRTDAVEDFMSRVAHRLGEKEEEKQQAVDRYVEYYSSFSTKCREAYSRVCCLVPAATILIRRELRLPLKDEEAYIKSCQESLSEEKKSGEALLRELIGSSEKSV